jgi:methionyl aminopeptidase
MKNTGQIRLYGPEGFEGMRKACQLTARASTNWSPRRQTRRHHQRDRRFVFEFGMDHGALPATLNYRGYTKSCCTSINHVVCHGIPNDKPLREGEIVNIDVTYVLDGWHGDSSRACIRSARSSAPPSACSKSPMNALMLGIAAVKPGARTGAIGEAIQKHAEAERCSVVRDFCGHGVGRLFHDAPNILHYGRADEGIEMRKGMIFTIEPMINLGRPHVKVLSDGWTAVTRDRSLSAQYEHTIGVTETGCEIFTLSPKGLDRPGLPGLRRRPAAGAATGANGVADEPDERQIFLASSPKAVRARPAARQLDRLPEDPRPPREHSRPPRPAARPLPRGGDRALADYELLELLLFR